MADVKYAQVLGFVQKFPNKDAVVRKQANGQELQEFTIKADWPGQPLVKVTLWGEYSHVVVPDDAFVAVDGKYEKNVHNGNTYHNLTAYKLVVFPTVAKAERGVANAGGTVAAPSTESDPF